ncbi:MAG: tetratricopeptide repeat protein [Terriglobia bacterium]
MKKIAGMLAALFCACGLRAAPQTRTIVVFPFENQSTSADLGWMSEAFAEVLSGRLSGPDRFVLGRQERNTAYGQLGIPPNSTLTLASEYEVAETLGVDWAVVGSFTVSGGQLSARAQLLDLPKLKLYPAIEESGPLTGLFAVQSRLAWRLLTQYDSDFAAIPEEQFAHSFPVRRPDALENYIRGVLATDDATKIHFLTVADHLDPLDHRAAYVLGRYYFKDKDYGKSVLWLSRIDSRDSNYLASLFMSGVDDFFLGRDQDAEAEFLKLAGLMPLNAVWNNLGVLQVRRSDYQAAIVSFSRAYEGDPTDADYAFNLAAYYSDMHRYREAIPYLETALKNAPDDLGARTLLAYAYSKLGNSAGSEAQLEWVAAHDGKEMTTLNAGILPQPRLKKEYSGEAFRLLEVAVHNSLESELAGQPPEVHATVYLMRGERFIHQHQLPEAVRELTEASRLWPGSAVIHLFLGQAYELQGHHHQALAQFRAALSLDENAVTHLWIAHTYLSLHQAPQALEQAKAALSLDPGNADAQRLIESIQAQAKNSRADP